MVEREGLLLIRRSAGAPTAGQRLVAHLQGTATTDLTTDEIMALTRGDD